MDAPRVVVTYEVIRRQGAGDSAATRLAERSALRVDKSAPVALAANTVNRSPDSAAEALRLT